MQVRDAIEAIGSSFPELASTTVSELAHSGEWWRFEVDGRYIFRFPCFDAVAKRLRVERNLLEFLQGRLPADVPDPVFFAENPTGGPTPFLGYERIEGTTLDSVRDLDPAARSSFAHQFGGLLAALHAIPVSDVVSRFEISQDRDEFEALDQNLNTIVEYLPDDVAEGCQTIVSNPSLLEPGSSGSSALIHGDIHLGNILVSGRPPEIRAVIDWNDAAIKDPASEFTELLAPATSPSSRKCWQPTPRTWQLRHLLRWCTETRSPSTSELVRTRYRMGGIDRTHRPPEDGYGMTQWIFCGG